MLGVIVLGMHLAQVEDEVGDIVMTVVQNKIDLIDEAVMTPYVECVTSRYVLLIFALPFRDEVDALAKRLKLKLFRVSVKEGFNVDQGYRR